MTTKPDCYGTMFPDLSVDVFNVPHEGKAFTLTVESSGGAITERLQLHPAAQTYGIKRSL